MLFFSRFSRGSSGKGVNGYSNGAVSYVSDIGADTAHSNNETVFQFDRTVSSFAKARSDCPNAFSKANKIYNDLINAENGGADALWEELTVLSYALGEHPISVCDIY